MLGFTPPYHSLQEMNLDWLLTKIKNMLRFLPDDGTVGQILRRTAHGAEWSDEQGGGGGAVNSVNGQTGNVVLDASDVGALPDTTVIPDSTSDLVNDSGFITAAGAPVQSVNGQTGTVVLGKSDIGLGNVDNVQQYSASNPPPYPVTSVNNQTGAVTISVPDSTSDLVNDSGFITAAGAPVQSVNGLTGAVTTVKHLWHNANPTANFDPQTISLAANTCSLFLIICRISAPDPFNTLPTFIIPGNPGWIEFPAGYNGVQQGSLVLWSKQVTASTQTSLSFGTSVCIGALEATNNGIIIPIDVYGF